MNALTHAALLPWHLVRLTGGLLADRRVPWHLKVGVAGGVLYMFSPVDLLPEGLFGKIGFLDDGVVILRVLRRLLADIEEPIALSHWDGDPAHLRQIRALLIHGDEAMAQGMRTLREAIFAPPHTKHEAAS